MNVNRFHVEPQAVSAAIADGPFKGTSMAEPVKFETSTVHQANRYLAWAKRKFPNTGKDGLPSTVKQNIGACDAVIERYEAEKILADTKPKKPKKLRAPKSVDAASKPHAPKSAKQPKTKSPKLAKK
jgi:hypothetical protein